MYLSDDKAGWTVNVPKSAVLRTQEDVAREHLTGPEKKRDEKPTALSVAEVAARSPTTD